MDIRKKFEEIKSETYSDYYIVMLSIVDPEHGLGKISIYLHNLSCDDRGIFMKNHPDDVYEWKNVTDIEIISR